MSQVKKDSNSENGSSTSGGIRKLFQHSAIYSISTSVQRLQGLIMLPIYTSTKYIPEPSEFGNYGLIYTFIAFMNFVYLYGMDSAFLRYFFLGKNSRNSVFSTTFLALLSSGLTTSVILLVFANSLSNLILFNSGLAPYIRLAALILFFDAIGNLPYLILRAEERPVTYTTFRMLRFILELGLNILFVVLLRQGVLGILYANLTASIINFVILMPFTFKYLQFYVNRYLFKEMVTFGLPFLPNGIAYMVIEMADRFLVTKYLGKEIMAFYHANYKFATVLLLIIVGFRNAWQPFFLKIAEEKNAKQTYSQIFNYYLFIAGIIAIFMTFFIRDILTYHFFDVFYLLGRNYWQGIDVIPWIVLSYLFFGVYVIFTPAFYITKKSKYMIIFTGSGAVLNILCNIILLPQIGVWGAVTATVIAYFAMASSIFAISQKIYPISIKYKTVLPILLMVGLAYLLYYIFNLSLFLRIGIFLALGIGGLWIFFKGEVKVFIRKVLRSRV